MILPYSIALPNIFVILLALVWLKDLFTGKLTHTFKYNFIYILPFILLFLAYLVSILYSADTKEALATIERRIPVLALPLIIISIPLRRQSINTIFKAFILSVALCCIIALLLTINYFVNNPSEYYLEKALWYLPQTINFHAPYLALYLVVSNILCLYFYGTKDKRGLIFFVFVLNNTFLFLISSRAALAVNWFFIAALSTYYLSKSKGLILAVLNLVVIGAICYVAYVNVPYLHTKISKLTEAGYGLGHRAIAAKAAIEVIKENPFFGVGVGDIQAELNKELPDAAFADMNVHNQYLHELMTYGFVGFTIFTAIFVMGFYKAITQRDLFFALFLISLATMFLTEVILSRYLGIMLFSVFYPLFLSLHISGAHEGVQSLSYFRKNY
ncbi:MAG: O-antigen ligase family protein [Nitrospirota bacterium]